ncbi:hypothetical protein N7454_004202 [Penicillium verhagenii]|nr:hypothetical protein N7454_004202 [Penicillium verhagenii]
MLQGESASIPPPVFDKPLHNIDELASGPEALSKPETAAPDVISSENSPWAVTEEGLIGPSEWHFPSRSQPQASYQNYSTSDQIARHSVLASQLGPNWFFKGLPVASKADLQWISGKTGQPVTGNLFDIPEHRVPVFSALQPSISQNLCELPEHDFTQTVFAAFFGSSFALEFPVLDRFLFEKTAETAYGSTDGDLVSPGCISARACVLSALSFACYQKMMRYMSDTVQMELCAAEAHRLLLSITEHVSLDTLQTALLLGLQSAFRGHWKDAAFFHSIACRIVWALKGHMEPTITGESSRAEARDSHHIRVLFCLCNMLDKDIALRTGNSPLLVDVHCDVESLDNSIDRYNYLPSLSEFSTANKTRENTAPFLPGDPHLSHLKEKVCSKLLSASAMSDKDHQLLENVRELDDQIERWRLSIPPSLRPALSVSQLPPPNPAEQGIPHYVRCLSLQLDHDHLVTVIHTTVRRCTLESSDGIRDLHDVVHSSFDPSLEASRSTFWCLRSLINIIAEDTYRFITAYSTTAAIPLFLNILTHPLDIQAQQDLELLISAANLIRNMPSATLTLSESTGIQEIGSFLWRLVWLGSCAVNKAEGEKMSAQ